MIAEQSLLTMKIPTTAPLFPWQYLDDGPDLKTLKEILDQVEDRDLLAELRRRRGNGRDALAL